MIKDIVQMLLTNIVSKVMAPFVSISFNGCMVVPAGEESSTVFDSEVFP